jgi:hypothetical protein
LSAMPATLAVRRTKAIDKNRFEPRRLRGRGRTIFPIAKSQTRLSTPWHRSMRALRPSALKPLEFELEERRTTTGGLTTPQHNTATVDRCRLAISRWTSEHSGMTNWPRVNMDFRVEGLQPGERVTIEVEHPADVDLTLRAVQVAPRSPWRRFADGWRIGQERAAARRAANPPKPPRPPRPESPVVWIALAALMFWR